MSYTDDTYIPTASTTDVSGLSVGWGPDRKVNKSRGEIFRRLVLLPYLGLASKPLHLIAGDIIETHHG